MLNVIHLFSSTTPMSFVPVIILDEAPIEAIADAQDWNDDGEVMPQALIELAKKQPQQ